MILKTFSIFDSKAEAFLPPFFSPTAAVALRNFEGAANDQDHAFHRHSADYTLFELGEFDDASGSITTHKAPINLGTALTLLHPLAPAEGPRAEHGKTPTLQTVSN